jgi:hypothetical protein
MKLSVTFAPVLSVSRSLGNTETPLDSSRYSRLWPDGRRQIYELPSWFTRLGISMWTSGGSAKVRKRSMPVNRGRLHVRMITLQFSNARALEYRLAAVSRGAGLTSERGG